MIICRERRSWKLLALGPVVVLLLGACAPPDDIAVGLNEVHTNVVFGPPPTAAPAADAASQPATTVARSASPAPSFIAPAPVISSLPPQPPSRRDPVPVDCASAGLYDVPQAAGPEVQGTPVPGVYAFEQNGSLQRGGKPAVGLPADTERTIRDVATTSNGGYRYIQVVEQFGARTATTYQLTKGVTSGRVLPNATASADGIFISSVVTQWADGAVERFEPAIPGLRIFPTPAELGATWESLAVDPTHQASMRLTGTILERFRIDACGELVEGWRSAVTIDVTSADSRYVVKADYIVIPQLGGLIGSDKVDLSGTYKGVQIKQVSASTIRRLSPVRPVPTA